MTTTDKTRKILWGRSGNRCAICKHELVVDATAVDNESIIGEECHIISSRPNGPRYDPSYPQKKLDTYENLILLCRVHHKMIDDQYESYAVDILRQMKTNHDMWVSEKLTDTPKPKPIRFRRVKQNIPAFLTRLTTGKEVLNIVMHAYAFAMDHDELKSQEEVDLIGSFLQTVKDWGDLGDDLEPMDRTKAAFDLTGSLEELESAGFFVFGGRELQLIEGGIETEPSDWPIAILRVLRKDNDVIIQLNLEGFRKDDSQQGEPGDKH